MYAIRSYYVSLVFPALGGNAVIYTVAGMAAMVGGTTGTVITAIIMTFEQTRDYGAILPIILTVSIAHLVRVSIRITSYNVCYTKLLRIFFKKV